MPTIDEIIESVRPPPAAPGDAKALRKEKEFPDKLAAFRAAIASLPETMTLVPVVYTKIDPNDNRATLDEFMRTAEPAFFRLLAQNHEAELRAAGFCDHALAHMHNGHAPRDREGRLYNYDVDHVIERGGGGGISLIRSVDPALAALPDETQETLNVNHIENFFLLPREVHELKNTINGFQVPAIPPGESRVIYMAVPKQDVVSPFYQPDGVYGPQVVIENTVAQPSYVALAATTRAAGLMQRFMATEEGRLMADFCRDLAPGSDADPAVRERLGEQVATILHGDERAIARYQGICEAVRHANECWAAVGTLTPKDSEERRECVKTLKKAAETLEQGFPNFITDDGYFAQTSFAAVRADVESHLSPGTAAAGGQKPKVTTVHA